LPGEEGAEMEKKDTEGMDYHRDTEDAEVKRR
jgi:hypothetical protein